ncbi:cytosolic protein [Salmonella phage 41]|nr:cytosolic protein [Salmonella phage 41]
MVTVPDRDDTEELNSWIHQSDEIVDAITNTVGEICKETHSEVNKWIYEIMVTGREPATVDGEVIPADLTAVDQIDWQSDDRR